ncbi:MAG TPA: HDIG domain-containing metalloprotein [Dehalococcoidia bacterium]
MKSREDAWQLLCEFTQSEGLRKHGLAVEAAMRAYARKHGEDEETWGIAGLLHDFDYERYPDPQDHARKGAEILRERGWPEVIVRAVASHSDYTGVPRESLLEKTLFAVDELTGFVTAVALVKPGKSLAEVDPASVRKKLKDKAFARNVSREDIQKGIQELGVDWEEHVQFVIDAMKERAEELGLAGVRA